MCSVAKSVLLSLVILGVASVVVAQDSGGYTVYTPGQLPTYVRPTWGTGGYTIQTPGQLPTYVRPTYGSTYRPPGQR